MKTSNVSSIKRSQKESVLMRVISSLFLQVTRDDKRLQDLFIHKVQLSPDKSICTVYFYTAQGKEHFKQMLDILKLYKPSLRKAIADNVPGRYTCDLKFVFDEQFEKIERIEQLFKKVQDAGDLEPESENPSQTDHN